jgi:DNA adenine methylase
MAKPFLKWVGGKSSSLNEIKNYYPTSFPENYLEPFLGGGAMFFYLSQKQNFKKIILSDISKDLINCYEIIRENPIKLMHFIDLLSEKYHFANQENFFYEIRKAFNEKQYTNNLECAGMFIFLNKTCFNGLFRVNKKGDFNTPFGFHKNPNFYEKENILSCAELLKNAELKVSDFAEIKLPEEKFFVYLDPPYKPVSKTSSFTSYSGNGFGDLEQNKLADFIFNLSKQGHSILLSNSSTEDNFFQELYRNFYINKIKASRMINSIASKRGKIDELLISNYNNYVKHELEFNI